MIGWKKAFGAALLAAGGLAQAATLTTTVTPNPATPGQTVGVDVRINDVVDLSAYHFSVLYDTSVLRALTVADGGFVTAAGTSFPFPGEIDNPNGTIWFASNFLIGPIPGASGSGSLLRITFEVVGAGTATLGFTDLFFADSFDRDIAVSVVSTPITSLAVTAVPEPATWLMLGAGLAGLAVLRRRAVPVPV